MSLASKIAWAGIACTLLATGMLVQGFPRSQAGSESNKEGVAPFVIRNEIRKMQETLRDKGHYRGRIDVVFGLQTRASLRAYQKAQNLPITGQVDTRTADGLGIRPESKWGDSTSAGRGVGYGGDRVGGEMRREKPSAGIVRGEGKARKTLRKEVSKATAIEDNRENGANKQQAENKEHNQ
jgi:peptidoglycan hydrolase-like protein with peptidoglycan-binding domain